MRKYRVRGLSVVFTGLIALCCLITGTTSAQQEVPTIAPDDTFISAEHSLWGARGEMGDIKWKAHFEPLHEQEGVTILG